MTDNPRRLSEVCTVPKDALDRFHQHGFVVVPQLFDSEWISEIRPAIYRVFERNIPPQTEDRKKTAYENAFIQIVNLGLREQAVRQLTHSPVLGQFAAELLGVDGVRIFIEDLFFKEPKKGHTPWHQDATCLAMEPNHMITAWVPLIPIHDNGRLRFIDRSHRLDIFGSEDISEETDDFFGSLITREQLEIVEQPVMMPGDVSFHSGNTIHGALPNRSNRIREAFAIHYFADGARIQYEKNSAGERLVMHCAPHLKIGDLAVSDAWPLVYSKSTRSKS
ncbi:MAG: phytanoyl-CoA dioxygenase family protein [Myxococcota bacterium]|nr:phytanoyl-CoA dioxygenase family protein [Myxococcota bacterium]